MNNKEKRNHYKREVEGKITPSGSTMVVTSAPFDGIPQSLAYDVSTPSGEIAEDVAKTMNWELEPVYIETVTETIERSKGLGRGISLGAGFKDYGELKFEIKPTKEVKKTQTVIWRKTPKE
jgi:hypothetical protein